MQKACIVISVADSTQAQTTPRTRYCGRHNTEGRGEDLPTVPGSKAIEDTPQKKFGTTAKTLQGAIEKFVVKEKTAVVPREKLLNQIKKPQGRLQMNIVGRVTCHCVECGRQTHPPTPAVWLWIWIPKVPFAYFRQDLGGYRRTEVGNFF